MNSQKYTMRGSDGELFLAVNSFVIAYAEKFSAMLTEHQKEVSLRGRRWYMPQNYEGKLFLTGLTGRHPDTLREVLSKTSSLDFEFRGYYKARNGLMYPVKFNRLVPLNGNLDDFDNGYIDDWEFAIAAINDEAINEFKNAHE